MITRPFGWTGVEVAVIGQGTWRMGERRAGQKAELAALRLGIDLGLTHIDTAEMYADGEAECLVGQAIAGQRAKVFITAKVHPRNASYADTLRACERSLRRLHTDHVDLYLLHWWSARHPVGETMRAMEELVRRGWTRFIGVSNFDVRQLREAQAALTRERLAANQVLYHLRDRGIERDVLPYCARHGIAVVGYTPPGPRRLPAGDRGRNRKEARPHPAPGRAELPDAPPVALHDPQGRPARARAGEPAALDGALTRQDLTAIDKEDCR